MAVDQRYVSRELTHFVGRDLKHDLEAQYERLLKILTAGKLLAGGEEGRSQAMWAHIADDVGLCSNRMFGAQIVCFCDIPVKDFPIHMTKYGPFGLAFNKRWLVSRGANPVFYVASGDSPASPFLDDKSEPRADLLNEQVKDLYRTAETYRELAAYGDDEMEAVAARFTHALQFFLQPQVLAFMKCFDPALEDDNEENFYMEREWRVYGSVEFRLEDVARVLMPSKFAGRLRKDVPDYAGQVEFTA